MRLFGEYEYLSRTTLWRWTPQVLRTERSVTQVSDSATATTTGEQGTFSRVSAHQFDPRAGMFRKGGHSTSVNTGTRRKVHTTFDDGGEMVEEFDLRTDELLVRMRRSKTVLGKDSEWEYLVGEPPRRFNADTATLVESTANPAFTRSQDTPEAFVWRVRNLPYPKETYSVAVDPADGKIVIRTSNKKFYKRFDVPELAVLGLETDADALSWDWRNNTLLIGYRKPKQAIAAEAEEKADRAKVRPALGGDDDGAQGECAQQ